MRKFIEAKQKEIRKVYVTSPSTLDSEFGIEQRVAKDYRDREILELLQNADDAGKELESPKVKFVLESNRIIILNTGKVFDQKGVSNLMHLATSNKQNSKGTIGEKGLGFRSLLNWGYKVNIFSGELNIEFSDEVATNFYNELTIENPQIDKLMKENHPEINNPISLLKYPKWIDRNIDLSDFNTAIVIYFHNEVYATVKKQLDEIEMNSILFTNYLKEITVDLNGEFKKISKSKDKGMLIVTKETLTGVEKKEFKTETILGEFKGKDYKIVLADEIGSDYKSTYLYSYFKTNITMPFGLLIHATLELSSDRNSVLKSESNQFVLEKVIDAIFKKAIKFFKNPRDLISKVVIQTGFSKFLNDRFNLENYYLDKLQNIKLLPSIKPRTLLSLCDNPIYHNTNIIGLFSDDELSNVLLHMRDFNYTETFKYVFSVRSQLRFSRFTYREFNLMLGEKDSISDDETVRILNFINNEYSLGSYDDIPNCFYNSKNERVSDYIYILDDKRLRENAPDFTEIDIIRESTLNTIQTTNKISSYENLKTYLNKFNIEAYDLEDFTYGLVESLNEEDDPEEYSKNLSSLFVWLFFFNDSENSSELISKIRNHLGELELTTLNGGKAKAKNLYFGQEYENNLGYSILKNVQGIEFVAKHTEYFDDEMQVVKNILTTIGVHTLPELTNIKITSPQRVKEYSNFVYSQLKSIPYNRMFSQNEFDKTCHSKQINTISIPRLEDILLNANFEDLIIWFHETGILHELLKKSNKTTLSMIEGNRRTREYSKTELPSYVKWLLSRLEWIPTESGKLSAPQNCLDIRGTKEDLSPIIEYPKVNLKYKLFKKYKISMNEIGDIYSKIGIGSKITDMNVDQVYQYLLNLPTLDPEGNKAQSIYKKIINDFDFSKSMLKNYIINTFFNEGKVLATYKGQRDYYPISEVFYTANRQYAQEILNRFKLLTLPRRQSESKVKDYLGVKTLSNIKFIFDKKIEKHLLQEQFDLYWRRFKPFAYAYRVDLDTKRQEKGRLKNYKVTLTKPIKAKFEIDNKFEQFNLNKGEYIMDTKNQEVILAVDEYVTNFDDLLADIGFTDSVAELTSSIIRVEGNRKDFLYLFPLSDFKRREFLRRDFDDIKIEKLDRAKKELGIEESVRNQFWESILRIYEIDEDYLNTFIKEREINERFIDYTDLSSLSSLEEIVKILTKLNITVSDYNEGSYTEINVAPYYLSKIKNLQFMYDDKIQEQLYKDFLKQDDQMKKQYMKELNILKNTDIVLENKIYPDVLTVFCEYFSLDLSKINDTCVYDVENIYNDNFNQLKNKINDDLILDELIHDVTNRSMILFGMFDNLIEIASEIEKNNQTQLPLTNPGSDSDDSKIEDATTTKKKKKKKKKRKPNQTPTSPSSRRTSDENKQITGFLAEQKIYNELRNNTEKYSRVEWVSGNAVKAGHKEGSDSYGYDIKALTNNDEWHYIEVKSSSTNETYFHITINELETAKKHIDNYYVYYVYKGTDGKTKKKNLGLFFKNQSEDIFVSDAYDIEPESYLVTFNIEENKEEE